MLCKLFRQITKIIFPKLGILSKLLSIFKLSLFYNSCDFFGSVAAFSLIFNIFDSWFALTRNRRT